MTDFDDAQLREAFARGAGEDGAEAVDPQVLWAAVHGEADAETTEALVDRLAQDGALLEEWRVARSFADEARRAQPAPTNSPVANDTSYRWWLGLAAAAAIVLVTVVAWPPSDPVEYVPGAGQVRDGTENRVRATVEGRLPADAFTLTWTPLEGARSYSVWVTTEDLEPVFEASALTEPSATVSPQALSDVVSGARLLWRVEAQLPDGTRYDSDTFAIEVE